MQRKHCVPLFDYVSMLRLHPRTVCTRDVFPVTCKCVAALLQQLLLLSTSMWSCWWLCCMMLVAVTSLFVVLAAASAARWVALHGWGCVLRALVVDCG